MGKFRVSVTGLMAVVALFGLEFAALRAGSQLWFSTIYSLTVLLLLFAVVAARYRRGDAGAFWFGFAVFGWGYLLLTFGPWSSPLSGEIEDEPRPRAVLLTTQLIDTSLYLIRGNAPDGNAANLGKQGADGVTLFAESTTGVAHLMMTFGVAILGGLVAVVIEGQSTRSGDGSGASDHGPPASTPTAALPLVTAVVGISLLAGAAAYVAARPLGPYFPPQRFARAWERNGYREEWYSTHLEAMREPSLWKQSRADPGATVYRLLWLSSFYHPTCVRVVKTGDTATLRLVILDGIGGNEPGRIAVDRTVTLSRVQWEELARRLDHLKFRTLPTTPKEPLMGDGFHLILEGAASGTYHITDYTVPGPEYFDLCKHLVALSGSRAVMERLAEYHPPDPESTPETGAGFR